MIIPEAIENIFCFLALCTAACCIGMLFSFLILYAKRKSVDYDKLEDLVAKSFWKIIFIGVIIAIYVYAFILK